MNTTSCHAARTLAGKLAIGILTVINLVRFVIFIVVTCFATVAAAGYTVSLSDQGFDPSPAGTEIEYTLKITNDNQILGADATTVTIDIPENARFLGVLETDAGLQIDCSNATIGVEGPTQITCSVPEITNGGGLTETKLVIKSLSSENQKQTITATLEDGTSISADTTIQRGSDLAVQMTGSTTLAAGSPATYSVTVTNNGPDATEKGELSFTIPQGLSNVLAPTGCRKVGNTILCAIPGPFAANETFTLDFQGQISDITGSIVDPIAAATTEDPEDGVAINNDVVVQTTVSEGTDVAISKSHSPAVAEIIQGNAVDFIISPTFTGETPGDLTITDTVPSLYTIDSVSAPGWTCTISQQTVECTQSPTQEAGANVALGNIIISTTATDTGTAVNEASVTQSGGPSDVATWNNTAEDGEIEVVEPFIDLNALITGPVTGLVTKDVPYEFTIGTSNLGNVPYSGTISIDFDVPEGTTLDNLAPAGWTCSPAAPIVGAQTMTCEQTISDSDPLGVGSATDLVTFDLIATVDNSSFMPEMEVAAGTDSNFPEKPENLGNNKIDFPIGSQGGAASAEISVTKTAAKASLESGDTQTFTISVSNAGPDAAENVTIEDALTNLVNANTGETGAGYVGTVITDAPGSTASCSAGGRSSTSVNLACVIDSLPNGATTTFEVTVRPGGNAGARSNSVTAYSTETADQDLENNTASVPFNVTTKTDVTVQKVASAATALSGQYLTYVVTALVPATGQSDAENVSITDSLPLDIEFISVTPSTGSCSKAPTENALIDASNRELICNFGTIENGNSETATIVVRPVNGQVTNVITNTVGVTTTSDETDDTNNSASIDVTVVNPSLDLQVNKYQDLDVLIMTDQVEYSIEVLNNGNSVANNVQMIDIMPSESMAFLELTRPNGETCTQPSFGEIGGTISCTIPRLEKRESVTFTVKARGTRKGNYINKVAVASDETVSPFFSDRDPSNNAAQVTTRVATKVDLWIEKPDIVNPNRADGLYFVRDSFDWVITVHNSNTDPTAKKQEADNVVFTDELPAGLTVYTAGTSQLRAQLSGLNGIDETETIGTAENTTACSIVGTAFRKVTCDLKTLPYGETITITIPTRATSIFNATPPKTYTNSAKVETSSLEYNNSNNSDTGTVKVSGSSIAFINYYDFNDDGEKGVNDLPIVGIDFNLDGNAASDASGVNFTRATGGQGTNAFQYIPRSTNYKITQLSDNPDYTVDGQTSAPGSNGTVASDKLSISGISIGDGETIGTYQFPKVPIARIGLAKAVDAGPTINANDGSFRTTFRLKVDNYSLEPLINVAVTDPLAGAAPSFGTYAALTDATADPMSAGEYTVLGTSGTCGGANAAYNGDTDITVASGITIAAGGSCTIDLEIRVQPTLPLPQLQSTGEMYQNQATVTGEGEYSGQTPATQKIKFGKDYLTDLSDNGSVTDANGNGVADDAGEDDLTPVTPVYSPSLTLDKTIDFTSLINVPVQEGDFVTYKFTVKNTGNLPLTNITLTDADPLVVLDGPNGTLTLQPGESSTAFSGQYPVQADDLANNNFDNTATVTGLYGKDKDGNDLTTLATDIVTEPIAAIAIIKSSDITAIQSPAQVGDEITFTFTVKNTGNVDLVNVVVNDPLTGLDMPVTTIASLAVGDEATLTATYPITQADIDARKVDNQAAATGEFGAGGESVNDNSGATYEEDAPLSTPLVPVAKVELIKKLAGYTDVNTNGMADEGDTLSYAFEIKNIGNVKLGDITISDPDATVVEDAAVTPFTLAVGASNTDRFTATYTLTQADIDRGYFENKATVSVKGVADDGTTPVNDDQGAQLTATDASDTGTIPAVVETTTDFAAAVITDPASVDTPNGAGTQDGDLGNDPTVAVFTREPSIVLVKTLVDVEDTNTTTREDAGDTAKYAFTVTNTGNVYLVIDTITDTIADNVSGGPITLAPGDVSNSDFTATYVIGQDDIDAGYIENTATVVGKAVDQSGNPINDGTGTQIEVSDTSDTDTDATGAAIADAATNETEAADGSTDGDATNDPTVYRFANRAQVSLIKSVKSIQDTDGDGILEVDETVTFAFTVKNIGSVALAGVTITDDNAELFHNGTALTTQTIDLAIDGVDSTTFTAVHTVSQADIDAGIFENSATVSGNAVTAAGVQIVENGADLTTSDISDAGTDQLMITPDVMDGTTPITEIVDPEATETLDKANDAGADSASDPTVVILEQRPLIRLIKSFDRVEDVDRNNRDDKDDIIHYTFTVENIGNMKLADITITDPKATSVKGGPITLDPLGLDSTSFTATYVIKQEDLDRGYFENTAQVTGTAVDENGDVIKDASDQPLVATDDSDTGTNPDKSAEIDPEGTETPDGQNGGDGDPSNDPTVVNLIPAPAISLVKIADTSGYSVPVAIGDWIEYTFEVTNTGNRTLYNVTVTDPLPGLQLTGAPIPVLNPGDTDNSNYTARYQLTLADFQTAKVINQATVTGEFDQTDPANPLTVTDLSGTEGDNDTPTETIVGEPEIDLVIGIAEIQDINGNANPDAGDVIVYTFTVVNTGTLGLVDVNMDLASLSLPLPNLSCAPVTLVPDEAVQLVCTGAEYTITQADVDRGSVTLSGEDQGTAPTSEVVKAYDEITTTLGNGGLTIQKTTVADIVYPGALVPYTLTITSKSDSLAVDVDVVDYMPKGFVYQNNTSKLDGTPIAATVSGRTLTFENVHLEPGQTVNITLNLFVSASVTPDEYINTTYPLSALSGVQLAPNATATVRVAIDAAMMCSSIIGRVFDDHDQDGVMDEGVDKGIPAVKLLTTRGLAIKTDEHGRFSVPCAALPSAEGGNFMLKIDERSLPSGYRMTTENPRVVRVTPGMLTKMNFGAALSRLIRIDLNASAFEIRDDRLYMTKPLSDGIQALVDQMKNQPAFVRLTYQIGDERRSEAKRNINAVTHALREAWRKQGQYQLNIETEIVSSTQRGTQN